MSDAAVTWLSSYSSRDKSKWPKWQWLHAQSSVVAIAGKIAKNTAIHHNYSSVLQEEPQLPFIGQGNHPPLFRNP